MSRAKKDAVVVHMKMERSVYEKLERYCADTDVSKTAAIEKILEEKLTDIHKTIPGDLL